MDTAILIPVISALSALLGVLVSTYVQTRNQFRVQQFQQQTDTVKYQRERQVKEHEQALERLMLAHTLLSKTAREFSITTLDILWRSKMTDGEYDVRYLATCIEVDQLRALIDLYEPDLSDDMESIHGQMNIFWGSFKNVLYQTQKGNTVDHRSSSLQDAHAAAGKIGEKIVHVKRRLAQRTIDSQRAYSAGANDQI